MFLAMASISLEIASDENPMFLLCYLNLTYHHQAEGSSKGVGHKARKLI